MWILFKQSGVFYVVSVLIFLSYLASYSEAKAEDNLRGGNCTDENQEEPFYLYLNLEATSTLEILSGNHLQVSINPIDSKNLIPVMAISEEQANNMMNADCFLSLGLLWSSGREGKVFLVKDC